MYWTGTEGASAVKGGRDPRAIVVEVNNTNRNVKLRIGSPLAWGRSSSGWSIQAGFPRGPRALCNRDPRRPAARATSAGPAARSPGGEVGAEAVETIEIPELPLDQLAKVLARPEGLVVELARARAGAVSWCVGSRTDRASRQPQHALVAAPPRRRPADRRSRGRSWLAPDCAPGAEDVSRGELCAVSSRTRIFTPFSAALRSDIVQDSRGWDRRW